jgi:peptide-methionine (S)-S-oxide reductase
MEYETALFAAGCFWGVQAVFDSLKGVKNTVVGYTGGRKEYVNPSYVQVCSGRTGHAESVLVKYDPKKIKFRNLLELFFMNHDPTTLNRQGPDEGEQYRSAIFYSDEKQKKQALGYIKDYQKKLSKPIVTQIVKAGEFYPAEDYHQKYYTKHKISCHINLPIAK